jgi:hypothetical protein
MLITFSVMEVDFLDQPTHHWRWLCHDLLLPQVATYTFKHSD